MTIIIPPLTEEERQEARKLWDALMFAVTPEELDCARAKLRGVPSAVRNAIVWASIARKTHLQPPRRDDNPFD